MPQNQKNRQQKPTPAPDFEPVRLNKALAQAGICSRRKADELIAQGRVSVNASMVTEQGVKVIPGEDRVEVDGREVKLAQPQNTSFTYILLNKPVHVVSTSSDPDGRRTVLDLLPENLRTKRLFPVGRLDYFSEGLLILTDDGDLTYRLTHPKHHLPKVYEVTLREAPAPSQLETMRRGMTLQEGEKLAPVKAEVDPANPKTLHLVLHQGINRQIRRMCRDLGLTILRLMRVAVGPLDLGALPGGHCRHLTPKEIKQLKAGVGLPA